MANFLFHTGNEEAYQARGETRESFLRYHFLTAKLDTPLGYLLLGTAAWPVAYFVATQQMEMSFLLLFGVIFVPFLIATLFRPAFGMYLLIFEAFLIPGLSRSLPDLPLLLFMDLTVMFSLLGWLMNKIYRGSWDALKNPISVFIGLWLAYVFLQVFSPYKVSHVGLLFSFRSLGGMMVIYFVGMEVLKKTKHRRGLIYLWITLSLLGGLYSYAQAIWGFSAMEQDWIMAHPSNYFIVNSGNSVHMFSFFSDPATLGILMATGILLTLVMLLRKEAGKEERVLLLLSLALMVPALYISGSRTAIIVLLVGLIFFALLSMNRTAWLIVLGVFLVGVLALALPGKYRSLDRFRAAFSQMQIDTYLTRESEWRYLRPYIHENPMGAGPGSTGIWGRRFSSSTELRFSFSDSGYARIAIETGWIGLALYCAMLFVILALGVHRFFQTPPSESRTGYLALLSVLFALILANYAQETLTKLPFSVFIPIAAAALIQLRLPPEDDENKRGRTEEGVFL